MWPSFMYFHCQEEEKTLNGDFKPRELVAKLPQIQDSLKFIWDPLLKEKLQNFIYTEEGQEVK